MGLLGSGGHTSHLNDGLDARMKDVELALQAELGEKVFDEQAVVRLASIAARGKTRPARQQAKQSYRRDGHVQMEIDLLLRAPLQCVRPVCCFASRITNSI